ncbi:hypothetical protein [Fimbriiglobus ruber]|uniref:YcxB-like protein domain-containing protein n=1 Tax=Fimbriiglobus ruber TaxID=1908690 RepID=A0A225D7Y8_9BACT|nr:hypothetical protein [Fimbriiglobus ruber]OWK37710.1 hypothetical protein FRUB_06830 [Fimbriiglobus ruber]
MAVTRVEFDLTEDDLIAAAVAGVRANPAVKKVRAQQKRNVLVLGAVWAFIVASLVLTDVALVEAVTVAAVVLALFVIRAWPTEAKYIAAVTKHIRNSMSDPAYNMALGRRVYDIYTDRLAFQTAHAKGELLWRSAARTSLNDDYLIVTFPGPTPFVLPREAFERDTDFDETADEILSLIQTAGGHVGSEVVSRPALD